MLLSPFLTRYGPIALVVVQFVCADQPPPELLGRWRSLETSSGGIGATLTFHPNGAVDFSPGAVVEMPYRIEGGELILPPATLKDAEQRLGMQLVGQDQLRLAMRELKRQGSAPDASHLILGEWLGKREMNGRQLETRYIFIVTGGACSLCRS